MLLTNTFGYKGTNKVNPLESRGNYSATSNNMNLVHWPLMGELLHLVQREGALVSQSPPRCTKCQPTNQQIEYYSQYCCIMVH